MRISRFGTLIATISVVVSLTAIALVALGLGTADVRRLITFCALAAAVVVAIGGIVVLRHPSVTANERKHDQLKVEAHTDGLTGLRNHRAFHEDLARAVAIAESGGQPVGLVLFDLDGLKTVNDKHGHQAGDRMIVAMAETLKQTLRARDFAYRIGGDEFAAILANETHWGAFRFAQRLAGALGVVPNHGRLAVSAGVAGSNGQSRDELIRQADLALIAAKRGRRGALIYTDDLAVRDQGYESVARIDRLDLMCSALASATDEAVGRAMTLTVSELAGQVAAEIGLGSERVAKVRRAALLCDVGLIALGRPGVDSEAEAHANVASHPETGATILRGVGLADEAEWVARHHERVDGTGLPNGLRGSAIPVEAAVLHAASFYEALLAADPDATAESALQEMERGRGAWFPESVLDALRVVIDRGPAVDGFDDEPSPNLHNLYVGAS